MARPAAQDGAAVIAALGGSRPDRAPGSTARLRGGNKLTSTEHRLRALRATKRGPLPGQSLVVIDPVRGLATDVIPREDAHAPERSLLGPVVDLIRPGDAWSADRNLCTAQFLFASAARSASVLIRQQGGSFSWEPLEARRPVGRTATGTASAQAIQAEHDGVPLKFRRVTSALGQPTKEGDTAIHLLTKLPADAADACLVADWQRRRWTSEGVFRGVTQTLRGAIDTLGYPKAALFGFCTALVAFNALAVAQAALRSAHGAERVEEEVSAYQPAGEVAAVSEGLDSAGPPADWLPFQALTPNALSRTLKRLAAQVRLERFPNHKRGPQKPRPKRTSGTGSTHVATARLVAARKHAARSP